MSDENIEITDNEDLTTPDTSTETFQGGVIVGKYITVPNDPTKSVIQMCYGISWKSNVESYDTIKDLSLSDFFSSSSNILETPIPELSDKLTHDELSTIVMLMEGTLDNISSKCNARGIIDPEYTLPEKLYSEAKVSDIVYNDDHTAILVFPNDVYERLFGELDDINPDEPFADEDFYGLNDIVSDDASNENNPFMYRIIELMDSDSAKIIETRYIENGITVSPDEFKRNPTDTVNIFRINWEKVDTDKHILENDLEVLNNEQNEYIKNKAALINTLTELTDSVANVESSISVFEDTHKTQPDDSADPYFDPDELNEEDAIEYKELTDSLSELIGQKTAVESQLETIDEDSKASEITDLTNKISEITNMVTSYEIGSIISRMYIEPVVNTDIVTIPKDYLIFISENTIDDDEINFDDTEVDNSPYYYLTGRFENREVNGNTTRCLIITSVNEYDERKTYLNLKTYHNFDTVYLVSNRVKRFINELRSENNNLSNESIAKLTDSSMTFIAPEDSSVLEDVVDSTIIPSLSVLIEPSEIEGGVDDDDEPIVDPDKPEDDTHDDEYKKYLHGGKINVINGIIFVIPDNSDIVKRIVYVNGYYYILMNNCYVYKLDNEFKLITTLDLGKLSTDISKTDIFSIGNMLIIQSDKTYVTDLESVKMNFGLADTDITINSIKVNTKTIVKINLK